MATNHLDLEEQEQLEQLKHFWSRYGNLVTAVLVAIMVAVGGWKGWQFWQAKQATQAAAMYEEVVRVSGEADKAERAFADMKERFGSSIYTAQAGLLVAKNLFDAGKADSSKAILKWLADKAVDEGYASVAKLRLATVLADTKAPDEALAVLNTLSTASFAGLVADRKGDIFLSQGKKDDAKAEYLKAWKAFDQQASYRNLIEFKLNALGVNPEPQEVAK